MKNFFFKRFNSIFFKTFFVLIASSIIPVLAANLIIHRQASSLLQKQIWNTSVSLLDKSSEMVNLIFRDIEQTQKTVADEKNVIQLAFNPHREEVSRNYNILTQISKIVDANEYIDSIYVYGVHAEIVLNSDGNIYTEKIFEDREWLPVYLNTPGSLTWLETHDVTFPDNRHKNLISCISTIPFGSGSSKVGCVVINIDEERIQNAIAGLSSGIPGKALVIGNNREILSHQDKSLLYSFVDTNSCLDPVFLTERGAYSSEYEGQKSLIVFGTSRHSGWKYVYITPLEVLNGDVTLVTSIIGVITVFYTILSLLLSFFISKGIYNPIEHLVGTVIDKTGRNVNFLVQEKIDNEYTFLENAYSEVFSENQSMEEHLNSVKPLIKEKLFMNLVSGVSESSCYISDAFRFLGYDMTLKNYVAIVLQIDDYSFWCLSNTEIECNYQKVKLTYEIEQILGSLVHGVCISGTPDSFIVIINFPHKTDILDMQRTAVSISAALKEKVESIFSFTVTLGLGRSYRDISNLSLSYAEALNALKYKIYQGKSEIIDISDVELDDELYYYHSERERRIINKLKTGDKSEVISEIDHMMVEIHNSKAVPYNYLKNLFLRIIGSMILTFIDCGLTVMDVFDENRDLFDEFSKLETLDDIGLWLKDRSTKIADAVYQVNQKRVDRNVQKLVEYIDGHLNEDISLNNLSDVVGLSASYVSRIFKEGLGINYVEYLSRKRVEKSRQLLVSTIFTIKEIGFIVGFKNIQTFLRTFKKYEGVTPGQYRDMIQE